jgi:hypothetical protein
VFGSDVQSWHGAKKQCCDERFTRMWGFYFGGFGNVVPQADMIHNRQDILPLKPAYVEREERPLRSEEVGKQPTPRSADD